jgi:hypothetical protein
MTVTTINVVTMPTELTVSSARTLGVPRPADSRIASPIQPPTHTGV